MSMAAVARNYLRWFELHCFKRMIAAQVPRRRHRGVRALAALLDRSADDWSLDAEFVKEEEEAAVKGGSEPSVLPKTSSPIRKASKNSDDLAYGVNSEF
jgi:hypothetical protein